MLTPLSPQLRSSLPRLNSPRVRIRFRLLLLSIFTIIVISGYYLHPISTDNHPIPSLQTRSNLFTASTPNWLRRFGVGWLIHPEARLPITPRVYEEVKVAKWMGEFEVPSLTPRHRWRDDPSSPTKQAPAFLKLHIFSSTTSSARERRQLIRQSHLKKAIPEGYRNLIEIKFVLPTIPAMNNGVVLSSMLDGEERKKVEEMWAINEEGVRYGDLIRLDGFGEGNGGESLQWIQWVGREGAEREAQWVVKCDDDTLPLLPSLLDFLASLDPKEPTYFGSALSRWPGYPYYFAGNIYGLSWGVVKTLASVDFSGELPLMEHDEAALIGEMMFSLPSQPSKIIEEETDPYDYIFNPKSALANHHSHWRALHPLPTSTPGPNSRYNPNLAIKPPPPSPSPSPSSSFSGIKIVPDRDTEWVSSKTQIEGEDGEVKEMDGGRWGIPEAVDSRSGLRRVDLAGKIGDKGRWWIADGSEAIAWTGLESDQAYISALQAVKDNFNSRNEEYLWQVPSEIWA